MKKLITILFLFTTTIGFSQESYFVFFKDKSGSQFDPISYFDAKALERKVMFGILISDSTDYPVSSDYLGKIELIVNKSGVESRWLNGVYVWATESQMNAVKSLPFVKSVIPIATEARLCRLDTANVEDESPSYEFKLAKKQLHRMQGESFMKRGIDGKGIRIAIFDGGFPEVDTHRAFSHIRREHRIIKTFDFSQKKEFVYAYNSHGLATFSDIAGIVDSVNFGLATGAEFLLARTEVNTEPFAEEQYWLAAAEWADKNGAHIISSSLGYTKSRYFPEQMDGQHSLVGKAANMAASKGMLVINAMGNDGDDKWKALSTPADADSILSVGGINPRTGYHINFSSFGPTKDGRLKPNVCAFGEAAVATKGGHTDTEYGTSFSTPLVSGFAACAWQTRMGTTNMEMKTAIEHSGDLFPYYDYAHGYGVPQASFFTDKAPVEKKKSSYTFQIKNDEVEIIYTEPLDSLQISRKMIQESNAKHDNDLDLVAFDYNGPKYNLYFHIANPDGKLTRYGIISVYSENPLSIPLSEIPAGYTLRIAYQNGFQEWKRP
jgi:subtilisin family serine protease